MDLKAVLVALRAGWWVLALGLLIGGLAATLAVSLSPTVYTSSTQLFVSTTSSTSTSEAFQGSQFSQERVASYAQLLRGEEIAERVIERLGLDLSPRELVQKVEVTVVSDTVLLDIRVTDESPRRAQELASALGKEFTVFVADLERPETGGPAPVKVTITDSPNVPDDPSSPQAVRDIALGALAGLVTGAALAILRTRLDRSVKEPEDASALAGAPVIGTIVRDDALEKQHVVSRLGVSRTAEDFRQLRTNLQFLNVDEPPKVIMVSSAVPSEGKTTLVVNLALALVNAGRKVIVVEADMRRPKVTRYLGMVGGVGLTNVLAGTADVDEVTQAYGSGGLSVIAAGPTPPNPGELLSSSHMAALVDKLRGRNDFVLVDAPPLLPVADSTGLAVMMDGVLLSVRYGNTRKDHLRQAAVMLERVGAKTLGVILNIVPLKAQVASAYGYGHSYGEEPGKPGTV